MLALDNNQLTGSVPTDIGQLRNLRCVSSVCLESVPHPVCPCPLPPAVTHTVLHGAFCDRTLRLSNNLLVGTLPDLSLAAELQ